MHYEGTVPTLTFPSSSLRSSTPYGIALPSCLSLESWTRTGSGWPCRCHSRPAFLKSPTSSFLLVSTLNHRRARSDRSRRGLIDVLKLRGAVGMRRPFLGLHVGLQRVAPNSRMNVATEVKCTSWPISRNAPAICRTLFAVQRNSDSGSPRKS